MDGLVQVQLLQLWDRLRTSYWFVPGLFLISAIGLSIGALVVDAEYGSSLTFVAWLPELSPDAARTFLSTVAGAVITIVSVSFSITIVALTMASSQFGPRLLRNFIRSRPNQVTLGLLLGTFVFALLTMRNIHTADEQDFVPRLSLFIAVASVISSLFAFIYFIHNVATSIRAPNVIHDVYRNLMHAVEDYFPTTDDMEKVPSLDWQGIESPDGEVRATSEGYLLGIEIDALVKWAEDKKLRAQIKCRPGAFIYEDALLMVYQCSEETDAKEKEELANGKARESFILGEERTPGQDFAFSIRQLVEIAVRALSPGVNDPFTAMECVDHLGAALQKILRRPMPQSVFADKEEKARVALPEVDFKDVVAIALDQLRRHAAADLAVTRMIIIMLGDLACRSNSEERREVLIEQLDLVMQGVEAASGHSKAEVDGLRELVEACKAGEVDFQRTLP